jgi:hypothetical protein
MKLSRQGLRKLIAEELTRLVEGDVVSLHQARGLPWEFGPEGYSRRERWQGPEESERLRQWMGTIKDDPEGRDVYYLNLAFAERAAYLLDPDGKAEGVELDVEPSLFNNMSIPIADDIASGVLDTLDPGALGLWKTDRPMTKEELSVDVYDIVSKIDAEYFDEQIGLFLFDEYNILIPGPEFEWVVEEVEYMKAERLKAEQGEDPEQRMEKTKELASQQDPEEVEEMGLDFERYLQGIESGDVIEFPQDDD